MSNVSFSTKQDKAEFLIVMCDCTINSDIGKGDFSLVLGLYSSGHAHVRSHVSLGMDWRVQGADNIDINRCAGPIFTIRFHKKNVYKKMRLKWRNLNKTSRKSQGSLSKIKCFCWPKTLNYVITKFKMLKQKFKLSIQD